MKENYEMRTLVGSEKLYVHEQSAQISAQTGFVGYLQGDLRGDVLLTAWKPWISGISGRLPRVSNLLKSLQEWGYCEYNTSLEECGKDEKHDFEIQLRKDLKDEKSINRIISALDDYAKKNKDDADTYYEIQGLKKELNTQLKIVQFKEEFDDILEWLKKGDNILSSFDAMSQYCLFHSEKSIGDSFYAVRIDTEEYTYLLRFTPEKADFNVYCYCYTKRWLDSHIEKAKQGIRFITPQYEEKFRIEDGGKVKWIFRPDNEQIKVCRYIDECHFEIGAFSQLYHICQFAEMCEKFGDTVQPADDKEECS